MIMASMKDIANHCNVSIATVSKALNGHTDVSQDTKDLILKKAKELGYHPNSLARALKTRRTYNIGVLFTDESLNGLTHDYFAHVLDSFKTTAEKNGYDITFINRNTKKSMSYLEHSLYRGFDGIVIACVNFQDPDVLELMASDLPLVSIDYYSKEKSSVLSDNKGGLEALTRHVYSYGHRRIAYIYGDNTDVTKSRLKSFKETLSSFGIIPRKDLMLPSHYRNPEDAYRLTKQLLSNPNPPSCILYSDDYSCIGGINALTELGLRIPEDISIAGYDGLFISKILSPKLTTYEQASREIGRKAAEKLIQHIENPRQASVESIIISGKVIEGGSVRDLTS